MKKMTGLSLSMTILLMTASAQADTKTATADTPYVSPRFKTLDANHDGKITLEEFVRDQIDDFNRRDENKDKTLSEDELDFPPGTPPDMKATMRKQMQERDLRQQQMQAENQKRMQDDMKRMQADQEKARQAAAAAAKAVPVKPAPVQQPSKTPAQPAKTKSP